MAKATKQNEAPKAKVPLTIAQVLNDLENGVDRNQMKEKYGLTRADIIRLFKLPELKGKKVKREVEPGFIIVTEAEEAASHATSEATSDATVEEAVTAKEGW